MFIEQEYYFWKMVHELVVIHDFDILHIRSKEQEVWLEKEYKWKTHVIRLKQKQINWRNELKRELYVSNQQIKQNRKLFKGGKVAIHTLFVSEHPPVDEWADTINELPNERVDPYLYYLSDDKKDEEKERFYKVFDMEPIYEHTPSPVEKEAMIPYIKQQIITHYRNKKQEAQSLFQQGKPLMTYVLLAINLLAFYLLEMNGGSTSVETLIQFGAKYNPAILEGEWWRILTSMFLHIGLLHLFMNMLALFYLGTATERIFGTARFTCIYFLSGIFGGLASFMLNPHVAAGASGAIFGLFGALLYFGLRNKKVFFRTMGWNLIIVIGINLAFGFLVPQIDNGAHIGGLLGGFIAAGAVHLPKRKKLFSQGLSTVVYCVLIAAMAYLGYQSMFNGEQVYSKVQETVRLNKSGDYQETITITSKALKDPGQYEAQLLFNRSYAYLKKGKVEEARQDLIKVIEIEPEMAEAHYNLAILYVDMQMGKKAAEHAETAAKLKPENKDFQKLVSQLKQN